MAQRIPFFIELISESHSRQLLLCRKIMTSLLCRNITPLPCARSIDEIRDALAALKKRELAPSIFIVNTFHAEDLVSRLDACIGTTPALFFVRDKGSSSAMLPRTEDDGSHKLMSLLDHMTQRTSCVWSYGMQSAPAIADKAALKLQEFLNSGNFDPFITGDSATLVLRKSLAPVETPSRAAMTATRSAAAGTVQGLLGQLSLSSLLVMLDMEKKSGELNLNCADSSAQMFLKNGRVVTASLSGAKIPSESKDGAEAIYLALRWKEGSFTFLKREIDLEDQIKAPVTQLLMEGARRIDEGPAPPR